MITQRGEPFRERLAAQWRLAESNSPSMRNRQDLEHFLAREVLGREIPRKPPQNERRGPARDAEYRAFVRSFPCTACGSSRNVEAAHTGSEGGMSMKSSDYSCIPLCPGCHRVGPFAYHRLGGAQFAARHGLDLAGECARLLAAWRARECA